MKGKIFVMIFSVLLCMGCKSEFDKKREIENSHRTYTKTKDGIRYFTTCLEGFKFIVTHAGHGDVVAGPIGKCV